MRKSIFLRIVAILMIVLVVSISITGAIFYIFLEKRVVEDKAVLLKQSGTRIVDTLSIYMKNQDSELAPMLFQSFLDSISGNAASLIWIAKDDGTLVMTSDLPETLSDKMDNVGDQHYRLKDKRQYELVAGTEGDYLKGDFYGLFKGTGIDWLTVRIPFSFEKMPPYGLNLKGMVLLHAKIPEIRSARNTTVQLFLYAAAAGVLVSLLLGFFFSRQFTGPMKQMSHTAEKIAAGSFSERLVVNGSDEFGQLAKSFNEMVDALAHLEQIRKDFVSNVSHELRTPLTSIKGFIDGIVDGTIPQEKQGKYLEIVRDETHRMHRMVNDLMDLTKMEGGSLALARTSFDICELIRICVISLQQNFIEKNLEFAADFAQERMFVVADKDAIQRLILNLMQNAVKFTPEEGLIRVVIRKQKDKAEISVIDSGIGIGEEELPYVFDRFYKTDKSRSSDRSGVGIGLAIVRSIIQAHEEQIHVESQPGKGTTFVFTLPMDVEKTARTYEEFDAGGAPY